MKYKYRLLMLILKIKEKLNPRTLVDFQNDCTQLYLNLRPLGDEYIVGSKLKNIYLMQSTWNHPNFFFRLLIHFKFTTTLI